MPAILLSLFILLTIGATCAQTNNATSEIIPLLEQGYLVPKVLPTFNATIGPFDITYPTGIVNYGNNLSLATVKYAPDVQFQAESAYPGAMYTLAIIDPDAPTPQDPTSAQIRHWLVADITPSGASTNYSSGTVLSAYKSPAPPAGSAAHRYTSVLMRQPSGQNISIYNQTSTSNFNLTLFIQQNALTIVSANYFNASQSTTSTSSSSPSGSASSGSAATTSGSGATTTQSTSDAYYAFNKSHVIMSVLLMLLSMVLCS